MSKKKTFIENLTDTELVMLNEGWKNGKSHIFRNRCHCILLSFKKHEVSSLMATFSVTRTTIYTWLNKWKRQGIGGLITKPGQGAKPKLSLSNEKHIKVVDDAIKNAAQKGTNLYAEIQEKLQLEGGVSKDTVKRFMKKKVMLIRGSATSRKKSQIQKNSKKS